jgi:hypothetical protein
MNGKNEKRKNPPISLTGGNNGTKITGSSLLAGTRRTGRKRKRFFGILSGKELVYVFGALVIIALIPWIGYYFSKKEVPVAAKKGFKTDRQVSLVERDITGYGTPGTAFGDGVITAADFSPDPTSPVDYIITKADEEAMSMEKAMAQAAAGDGEKEDDETKPDSFFRDSLGGFGDAASRLAKQVTEKPKTTINVIRKITDSSVPDVKGGFSVGPELKGAKARKVTTRGTYVPRVKPRLSEIENKARVTVARKGEYRSFTELTEAEKAKRIGKDIEYLMQKLNRAEDAMKPAADLTKMAMDLKLGKAEKAKIAGNPKAGYTGTRTFAPLAKSTVAFEMKKEMAMAKLKLRLKIMEHQAMLPYKRADERYAMYKDILVNLAKGGALNPFVDFLGGIIKGLLSA